jgi:hypothetical protein
MATIESALEPQHLEELKGSAIDAQIIALNFRSIASQDEIFELLYPHAKRKNGGKLTERYQKAANSLIDFSGWICQGRQAPKI